MQIYQLKRAGKEAAVEYLEQRCVSTGNTQLDEVLEGGIEAGNYYLFLGAAKAGKSTILRCLGMKLAQNFPVLYVNFEQTGKNVFAKIYQLKYGESFREQVHADLPSVHANIAKMPDDPFYIAFWPQDLESKAFNTEIAPMLEKSIVWMKEQDEEKRIPVIIMENLSDIYNERVSGNDSLVNIVTQTAQDIKNFNIKHETATFLAHHSSKLGPKQPRPNLDDVRDSKRVVDLAHSIFTAFVREETDRDGVIRSTTRHLAYLAGRGIGEYREWEVSIKGLDMTLQGKNDDIATIVKQPPVIPF